jgi:hypothetical protein
MAVNQPIFALLAVIQQRFVKNSHIEFHENPVNGLVVPTRPSEPFVVSTYGFPVTS